jgi:uncharacterized protein (DUF427 family)
MSTKQIRIPGPGHPITIVPANARIVVRVGAVTIADSKKALRLQEAAYAPVYYIPTEDVNMESLFASKHETYCPYKGGCSYYAIPVGGERSKNAVWRYLIPYEAVAQIAGHVAFYPDRVESFEVVAG